ncbi:MAG: FdtA/QdtA family cupin domain-containing protein [Lachnospiraceae bacterium]|nr:FdtA/QdtA family cupin domain-containing protein [Lachnospiraceae bacterium]
MDIHKLKFQMHGDNTGTLVALEEFKEVPFQVKRVYYMYDTKNDVVRGRHAHKSLEQVIICVHGSCKIKLDDGRESEIVTLDKPNEGLYLSNTMWREVYDFSPDAVLMVLASELYQESDYIRDYKDFLDYIKNQKGGNDEAT